MSAVHILAGVHVWLILHTDHLSLEYYCEAFISPQSKPVQNKLYQMNTCLVHKNARNG